MQVDSKNRSSFKGCLGNSVVLNKYLLMLASMDYLLHQFLCITEKTSFSGTYRIILGYFLTFGKVPLMKDSVNDKKGISYSATFIHLHYKYCIRPEQHLVE